MHQTRQKPQLAPAIEALLDRLRRRIRIYVWIEGLAVVGILLGASFWLSLALDWLFEPPPWMRIGVLAVVGVALAYLVLRYILQRAFVRFADRSLALLVERRFTAFHDSLLTAVELASAPAHAEEFNAEMLARTEREALAQAGQVELDQVLNTRPLVWRLSVALLLGVSVLVFALAASESFGIWTRRTLVLSPELWPRMTHLVVDGIDAQGRIKVARGADLTLTVRADASPGRQVPEIVEVRCVAPDRRRDNMSREGEIRPGRDRFQNYAYIFKGVLESIEFYVVGGDDRVGPLRLEVVDSPTIRQMALHCEYPPYLGRPPRTIPVTGMMQVPRGTRVTLESRSNKDLVEVRVTDVANENAPVTRVVSVSGATGPAKRDFQFLIDRLDADKLLLFDLLDRDGIRSREPVRLALSATPDEPPQIGAQLRGIGTAITNRARLPAQGEITDDYGLEKLWFEVRVDDQPPRKFPLHAAAAGKAKVAIDEALEIGPLSLKPKQKLQWTIQAADRYALATAPNVGSSQRYLLDVVTPEQLRSLLEARELVLRKRFETLIQEFSDTRDSLARIELGARPPAAKATGPQPPAAADRVEPGDERPSGGAGAPEAADPQRAAAMRRVQAERVLQNSERSGHETLGVAAAFDDIREELINNRVDTEELKSRLKEGIADPLKRLVSQRFPQLAEDLKKLENSLDDARRSPALQAQAVARADAILVEMRQVLSRMLELETFNEVLDLVRDIIRSQENVIQDTKTKQKKQLFDSLEE